MAIKFVPVLLLLLVAFTATIYAQNNIYAQNDGIDSSYDYVVVGAGTAGSVLAKKFSDAGYTVVVLERGKRIPTSDLNARLLALCTQNWIPPFTRDNLHQQDSLGNRQNVLVGDVAGGGGMVNGGIGHLGSREFWNSFGQSKWTFDANIAPAFNRLKAKLSLQIAPLIPDASLRFSLSGGSASTLNYNLNDPAGNPTTGFGNISLVNKASALGFERDSTLFAYLDQAPDVDIAYNATVTRIAFDDWKRARKVEFVQDGVCSKVRARRGVVLAAGTYGSAEILLRSGVGPAADLQALGIESVSDLPVGKNLRDHQVVTTVYVNNCPVPASQQPQLAFSPGTQVAGFVKSNSARAYPDIQYTFVPFGLPGPVPLMAVVIFLVDPDTRGNITLASLDPLKPSLKYYEYPGTGTDNARTQWAINFAESFMATPPFNTCLGPRVSPAVGADLTSFVTTTSSPGYHVTGTNSMGQVVDQDLKVLGTRNLFVADASVLPAIPNGNTNIPAAIVAERGAELILNAVFP